MFIGSKYQNDLFSIEQNENTITIDSKGKKLKLQIRIPEYVENFTLSKEYKFENGYAVIEDVFDKNTPLIVNYDTPIRRVFCNPKVKENHGKVAVAYGKYVMCAEGFDNKGDVNIEIAENPKFTINGEIIYGKASDGTDFCLIPYYKWCNRANDDSDAKMSVWLKQQNMHNLNSLTDKIGERLYEIYE